MKIPANRTVAPDWWCYRRRRRHPRRQRLRQTRPPTRPRPRGADGRGGEGGGGDGGGERGGGGGVGCGAKTRPCATMGATPDADAAGCGASEPAAGMHCPLSIHSIFFLSFGHIMCDVWSKKSK